MLKHLISLVFLFIAFHGSYALSDTNSIILPKMKPKKLFIANKSEKLKIGNFESFFTYDECKEARFNGYQSGGRLIEYKDNTLLMTIGDFQNFTPAQDKNSFFGNHENITNSCSDRVCGSLQDFSKSIEFLVKSGG